MNRLRHKATVASACVAALLLAAPFVHTSRASAQGATKEFTISGDHFAFAPLRIEVQKDDLVKIIFTARDIANSFTIDQFGIAIRAAS
jgi:heme/copper-type cytochrome/quinol oxidase subunit 2